MKIEPDKYGDIKAVTYSGPTYIAIRSGKHCSSTAYGHASDFQRLVECAEFDEFCKTNSGESKPIVMIISDGGPDENEYRRNAFINFSLFFTVMKRQSTLQYSILKSTI